MKLKHVMEKISKLEEKWPDITCDEEKTLVCYQEALRSHCRRKFSKVLLLLERVTTVGNTYPDNEEIEAVLTDAKEVEGI